MCACVVHKKCHDLVVSECTRMKKDSNEVRVCVCKCICDDKIVSCGSISHIHIILCTGPKTGL